MPSPPAIHSGAVTHHQDQAIPPLSLRPRKMKNTIKVIDVDADGDFPFLLTRYSRCSSRFWGARL
jgi:hypothetical protein